MTKTELLKLKLWWYFGKIYGLTFSKKVGSGRQTKLGWILPKVKDETEFLEGLKSNLK